MKSDSKKFKKYLEGFISNLGLKGGDIVVLKGIPLNFARHIGGNNFLSGSSFLIDDDHVDFDGIIESKSSLVQALFMPQDEVQFLLYEAYVLISQNINFELLQGKQFHIIDNNLLPFYQNTSGEPLIDIEQYVAEGRDFSDHPLFQEGSLFFINAKHIGDERTFVQYFEPEQLTPVTYHNLFNEKEWDILELEEINEEEITQESAIYRIGEDETFLHALSALYNDIDEFLLYVDNIILGDKSSQKQIGVLIDALDKMGIILNLRRITYDLRRSSRPELNDILQKYWGEGATFRSLEIYVKPDRSKDTTFISQAEVVENVIKQFEEGKDEKPISDVFLTAPTGAGKSLLFQLPAIYLAEKHNAVTIVVSPLIALMSDQVDAMKKERGYKGVAYINSELSLDQREEVLKKIKDSSISVLYLSPELLLSYHISYFLGDENPRKLGLIVIDEAHLVTTWGRDFRVDYWYLGYHIQKIRKYSKDVNGKPMRFPVIAVTATAPYNGPQDIVFETISSLLLYNAIKYIGKARRDDIMFDVNQVTLNRNHDSEKITLSADRIAEFVNNGEKVLTYCPWTKQVDTLQLNAQSIAGQRIARYYGQLNSDEKADAQEGFKNGTIRAMVSTKAFGMGVDIPDITRVYHHAPSGNLSDYIQEIGRAARDKNIDGVASIDYAKQDLKYMKVLFGLSSMKHWQLRAMLSKLYELYRRDKKRNMLVATEDFAHIFSWEDQDISVKVKSGLMLLEKDLEQRYSGIKVIIGRPKSLYTRVYARIKNEEWDAFDSEYGKYIRKQDYPVLAEKGMTLIELNLEDLWKEKFNDMSFPSMKYKFYNEELIEGFDVKPKICLIYDLFEAAEAAIATIEKMFDDIEKVLMSFEGNFFSKDELRSRLSQKMDDRHIAKRVADFILSIYSSKPYDRDMTPSFKKKEVKQNKIFIQARRQPNGNVSYKLIDWAISQIKSDVISTLSKKLVRKDRTEEYVSPRTDQFKKQLMLAQVVEIFGVGTYEIRGGEHPMMFVRINDPYKLANLARDTNYQNSILQDVARRQEHSVQLLDAFFNTPIDSKKRWDIIEDYFLGKDQDEMMSQISGQLPPNV